MAKHLPDDVPGDRIHRTGYAFRGKKRVVGLSILGGILIGVAAAFLLRLAGGKLNF